MILKIKRKTQGEEKKKGEGVDELFAGSKKTFRSPVKGVLEGRRVKAKVRGGGRREE